MGGIAISADTSDSLALIGVMKLVGGVLSSWEAHEILRGVKTLAVRMDRHCDNALALADRLRADSRISRVYYPVFTTATDHAIARRVLREPHWGALVSIELKDNTGLMLNSWMRCSFVCGRPVW